MNQESGWCFSVEVIRHGAIHNDTVKFLGRQDILPIVPTIAQSLELIDRAGQPFFIV